MSDVVKGDPESGAWLLQRAESHDEFLELSAYSTTGLLSGLQRRRLEEHLRGCPTCRRVHAQYQALLDAGLPSAIVDWGKESEEQPASESSAERAESALFARLDREEEQKGANCE
jgi:anti-sigma factor RsiW